MFIDLNNCWINKKTNAKIIQVDDLLERSRTDININRMRF